MKSHLEPHLHRCMAMAVLSLAGVATTAANAQTTTSPDPSAWITSAVTQGLPESAGIFSKANELALDLKHIDLRQLLPTNVTPGSFLQHAQAIAHEPAAQDIAGLGVQSARLALQIEDLKLNYLRNKFCAGAAPAPGLPDLNRYNDEVQAGCQLLALKQKVMGLKLRALNLLAPR